MLRTIGFGLVTIMVLAAIFGMAAGNHDSAQRVGYGGTDNGASSQDDTAEMKEVKATINTLFQSLNSQDKETFESLLLSDAGDYWRVLFDRIRPEGWTINILAIDTPQILGKRCAVDVKILLGSTSPSAGIPEPTTLTMQLLRRDTQWLVADPV